MAVDKEMVALAAAVLALWKLSEKQTVIQEVSQGELTDIEATLDASNTILATLAKDATAQNILTKLDTMQNAGTLGGITLSVNATRTAVEALTTLLSKTIIPEIVGAEQAIGNVGATISSNIVYSTEDRDKITFQTLSIYSKTTDDPSTAALEAIFAGATPTISIQYLDSAHLLFPVTTMISYRTLALTTDYVFNVSGNNLLTIDFRTPSHPDGITIGNTGIDGGSGIYGALAVTTVATAAPTFPKVFYTAEKEVKLSSLV